MKRVLQIGAFLLGSFIFLSCNSEKPDLEFDPDVKDGGIEFVANKDSINVPTNNVAVPKGEFKLFHQVRYKNTPADLSPFLNRLDIAYETETLNSDNTPNPEAIKDFARRGKEGVPATLDLETWPYWPLDEIPQTVDYFVESINAFKSVNLASPVGFYAAPPKQIFHDNPIGPDIDLQNYDNWLAQNEGLKTLAAVSDIFFPSFYTFSDDWESWTKMVDVTIEGIGAYNFLYKPVYAYIWPQYHENSPEQGLQYIDTALWHKELDYLYDKIDGVVIWTSNKTPDGQIISWDPNMPWWQATKNFMVEKELAEPFIFDSLHLENTDNKVQVYWRTEIDASTQQYIVQRSGTGSNYADLSTAIDPGEHPYAVNAYSFEDDEPLDGDNFYRIAVVNKDNQITYTDAVKIFYEDKGIPLIDGTIEISMDYRQNYGAQDNVEIFVSNDFDGNYDAAGVQKATWTKIEGVSFERSKDASTGSLDISDYEVPGEAFYFALRYKGETGSVQSQWFIRSFEMILQTEDGPIDVIPDVLSGGWEKVTTAGPGTKGWNLRFDGTNDDLFFNSSSDTEPANEGWVISKRLNPHLAE